MVRQISIIPRGSIKQWAFRCLVRVEYTNKRDFIPGQTLIKIWDNVPAPAKSIEIKEGESTSSGIVTEAHINYDEILADPTRQAEAYDIAQRMDDQDLYEVLFHKYPDLRAVSAINGKADWLDT